MTVGVAYSMIDIAANLTNIQFRSDVSAVIERARAHGVAGFLVPGITLDSIIEAITLAEQHADVFAMAGIHPHHSADCTPQAIKQLTQYAAHPRVVAWGEIGLDFFRNRSPRQLQIEAFEAQLVLATTRPTLPVFFHERDAFDTFADLLAAYAHRIGKYVVHCFTNDCTALRRYLDLGAYIGITGWVCDPQRGKRLRQLVQYVPLDRLLIETDCPYLLPKDLPNMPRNRRNEPCFLRHVAQRVAALRRESVNSIIKRTSDNARALFALPCQIK